MEWTPFLNQAEASELFRLMSAMTDEERRKWAALELLPRELLGLLTDRSRRQSTTEGMTTLDGDDLPPTVQDENRRR